MLSSEPLTSLDLVRDMLSELEDREWVHTYERCPRGCCGDWRTCCATCDADESDGHKPDCKLKAVLIRARAFISIEEQLAEEREQQMEAAHG